ncbi:MAG: hypothetical protein HY873_06180 [Chloroflexi bacterium]|nr:hypothetical protein [Chloroflexota bacterium]
MNENDQREILEQVREMMDECASLLRRLDNPRIEAYCLAAFEGRNMGWLGRFERDIIDDELKALGGDEEEGEG